MTCLLGCLAGYMIGGIPFGYLVFLQAKGTDIRTLGSGNIGATNVGRMLGFRYFLLVFALDVLKGFVPTFGLPFLLQNPGAPRLADLPVFVGLAAILGHNFPVYLRLKGGKGVATSLGVLLALDPIACAAAAVGFFLVFLACRYVSLSSIAGALAFVAGHFAWTDEPWSRQHLALSLLAIAIAVLLIIRHHKNLRRIIQGTEPKVPLRQSRRAKEQPMQPSGRISPRLVAGLVVLAAAILGSSSWLVGRARAPIEINAGPWTLHETHRELTGQQRASRVIFADQGRKLAVMCPRYNKVLLYDVTVLATLEPSAEIALEGRPMSLATAGDLLMILERPPGDDKHLQVGWWETYNLDGERCGPRVPVGYYPDDLAITPDGRYLLVLSSGRAEGDQHKPLPGLDVFELAPDEKWQSPNPIGHLDLEPKDDGDRIVVSDRGGRALVTLPKRKEALAVDLSRPEAPRLAGRTALADTGSPYISVSDDGDWIIMPTLRESEAVAVDHREFGHGRESSSPWAGYLLYTLPDDAVIELAQASPRRSMGRFPIKGPLNLTGTRPSGLAFCAERDLCAVTTKPGAVHLVSIRSRPETGTAQAHLPRRSSSSLIKR
jgi:glycerol-3-phosphate acyltransferase PlsY